MAIDSAPAVDAAAGERADDAYVSPRVDFLLILFCAIAIAFAGAAVMVP